jgi:hypothetical protein
VRAIQIKLKKRSGFVAVIVMVIIISIILIIISIAGAGAFVGDRQGVSSDGTFNGGQGGQVVCSLQQ